MRRRLLLLALPCLGALACHPCDSVGDLRVNGDFPYVRCAQLDPPEEGERRLGDVAFEVEGRALRFASPPARIAFFRGPAPRSADLEASLSALVERGAGLFVMLGGAGDDVASAERSLRALAATERPALVLAGGRDEAEVLSDAFEALGDEAPGVVDARGLRVVRLGATSLLLLSGAPAGRYARTDDACGFGPDDLEALRDALPEDGPRYLVSWAAPASELTLGFDRVQAGDPELAQFVTDAGLLGSVSAWPALAAGGVASGEGGHLSAVAGALGAPHARSAEGAVLEDGPLLLKLGPAGLAPVAEGD